MPAFDLALPISSKMGQPLNMVPKPKLKLVQQGKGFRFTLHNLPLPCRFFLSCKWGLSNKVTYSRIKEHLEKTYNTSFSYGTVVQLGVAQNKRRKSSKNYKGLARVTCRRTRKGFTIRYNPDQHWSSALYHGLDYIQYADGTDKVILNRDDQAGFRLDSLATLCIQGNVSLATNTDFVTKYPAVLQTSSYNSYNFTETKTVCRGCKSDTNPQQKPSTTRNRH